MIFPSLISKEGLSIDKARCAKHVSNNSSIKLLMVFTELGIRKRLLGVSLVDQVRVHSMPDA